MIYSERTRSLFYFRLLIKILLGYITSIFVAELGRELNKEKRTKFRL